MGTGPLAGIRVVELAGIGPAPFAAMLLADLGADVVRVDRPSGGLALGGPEHDFLNRGKRSVLVDLKNERGAEAVLALAEQADVLLEGYRPGVAERLGVGPEQCWARNPKLVYGRMTGWGQDGPLASAAGHDIGYIAITGVLGAIGRADGPPQVPMNLVGDFGGGAMYLVVGVLAALLEAKSSGKGQVVDAAIVDGTAHLATMIFGMMSGQVWRDQRGANLLDTGAPFYDVFETADGRYMGVGALEPQFYAEFVTKLGADELVGAQYDLPNWGKMRERFAELFRTKKQHEWAEIFEGSDACVSPILSFTEAGEHPHLTARGTYQTVNGAQQPAPAPRFSRTENPPIRHPSIPGADSRNVLSDWDISAADDFLTSGAVLQRDGE